MDDNSHRHHLETSPLTVGFIGVMGGVMLVAICHVMAMLFCRSGGVRQQQTTQTTADDNISHVVDDQEHAAADDELSSVAANASTTIQIQVIVDDDKSLTKYYPCKEESDTCAVCLGEFKGGHAQVVRVLPQCGHVFHVQCIDMWLSNHRNCPLCRANALLPPNHSSNSRGGAIRTLPEMLISGS